MARVLATRHHGKSVGYLFQLQETHSSYYSQSYKIANDAQPSQEFSKKMEKTITMKEQQFVQTANADSLEKLLSDSLYDATRQRDKHASSQKTIVKVGKATQTFASNFSGFLQAYSGIIEIMKGADQQYGGVAYSALSLLLIVCTSFQKKHVLADNHRSRSTSREKKITLTQHY